MLLTIVIGTLLAIPTLYKPMLIPPLKWVIRKFFHHRVSRFEAIGHVLIGVFCYLCVTQDIAVLFAIFWLIESVQKLLGRSFGYDDIFWSMAAVVIVHCIKLLL